MKLENSKRVGRVRLLYYVCLLLAVASIPILFWQGIDDVAWIALVLFLLVFFASQFFSFNYIDYKSSEKGILLRYYSALSVNREYQQIEFPLNVLADVRKEKCCGKTMEELILAVQTNEGIAEYEPISLFGLSKAEEKVLMTDLHEILDKSPSKYTKK
ncbi:MAG: hypothetical protein ACK5L5_06105 [Bacteroidales bacterium]